MNTPRQIVPLRPETSIADAATIAPSPQLTYHGGPLLANAQVVTVFWGVAWQQSPQDQLVVQLNQFFDFILTSSLIDLLAEYSVPAYTIGHGARIGAVTVTDSEPGSGGEVTDAQIQQALQNWIAAQVIPTPTANTLYFVYLPPGVTSVLNGSRSCQQFCGYHNHSGSTLFYAVEPFVDCNGCQAGSSTLDALTEISSHELCEAITDPALDGWFDDATQSEIGDICNFNSQDLGGYLIQTEWSNQANACVAAPPASTGP